MKTLFARELSSRSLLLYRRESTRALFLFDAAANLVRCLEEKKARCSEKEREREIKEEEETQKDHTREKKER